MLVDVGCFASYLSEYFPQNLYIIQTVLVMCLHEWDDIFPWPRQEIPHFKEVVIMSTVCEVCGARDSEVKSSGGIEPKGQRISLRLTDPSDLSRDVLKVSWLLESSFLSLEGFCISSIGFLNKVFWILKILLHFIGFWNRVSRAMKDFV